jgi:hypothetical protein
MPKKNLNSIGTDVLCKGKRVLPSKVELTIKPPHPLDFMQLKIQWEKEEQRELSDEEFRHRLEEYLRRFQRRRKEPKSKIPKDVITV